MRRRQSIKTRSELERRKSTSSERCVYLDHLDPVQAQRAAQLAAKEAFIRAQNKRDAKMPGFFLSGSPSPRRSMAGNEAQPRTSTASRERAEGRLNHCRQPSVRFIGPSQPFKIADKWLGSYAESSSIQSSPRVLRRSVEKESVSDARNIKRSTNNHDEGAGGDKKLRRLPPTRLVGNYLNALAAQDEYYTFEDDIASLPSSYRRLRRSRSMFTSADSSFGRNLGQSNNMQPSVSNLPCSQSCQRLGVYAQRENGEPGNRHILRAPKSMSFLRGGRTRAGSLSSRVDTDVDGARDEKYSGAEKAHIKSKSSLLFRLKDRKPDRNVQCMRKSLRSSSSNYALPTVAPATSGPECQETGLKGRARKPSRTLRSRLRDFLGRSKSENAPVSTLPNPQHIKSQKTHIINPFSSLTSLYRGQDSVDGFEGSSLHRVPSNLPSLRSVPSSHMLRCSRGSVESVSNDQERKVSDDKSLTTWSNSGPSTLTSQQQREWGEWERQRLSVIKENGCHAPSPSLKRRPLMVQPIPSENPSGEPISTRPTIDSDRVYSALMKRLNDTQQLPRVDEDSGHRDAEYLNPLRAKPFEEKLNRTAQVSPLTIRAVPADDSVYVDDTPTQKGKSARPFEIRRQGSAECTMFVSNGPCAADDFHQAQEGIGSRKLSPSASAGLRSTGSSTRGKPLSDTGSTSYGSPTSHLFRTASPYRRALQKSMEDDRGSSEPRTTASIGNSSSENSTLIRRPNAIGSVSSKSFVRDSSSEVCNSIPYSESVYSCQTDERVPRELLSPPSLSGVSTSADPPVAYRPTGRGHRVSSSVGSIDWKTWLAANVAKLEPHSEIELSLPRVPQFPHTGHVREHAQTHDDDDTEREFLFGTSTWRPSIPSHPLMAVEPNIMKTSPSQQAVKGATPSHSSGTSLSENKRFRFAPPVPPRSPMRTVPASMKSQRCDFSRAGEVLSPTSTPGLTAAVERQFGTARMVATAPITPQRETFQAAASPFGSPVIGSGREAEVKGSKRIVDLFLSSRRQRVPPREGSSGAFI